jgi:hypothetical protein
MKKIKEIQDIEKKKELAATKIQALGRGYLVRKTPLITSVGDPRIFEMFVTSTWDIPSITQKMPGYFVYVGNSGFYNLALLQQMVKAPIISENGMSGVPKLFIVDICFQVKLFWNLIKKVAAASPDYQAFLANLKNKEIRDQIVKISVHETLAPALLFNYLNRLMNQQRPEFSAEAWYSFFRQMILKMTVLNGDWHNETIFKAIRGQVADGVPIAVYASNIPEFGNVFSESFKCIPETIFKNIDILKPTLTIHARTSVEKYKKQNGVCPDTVLVNPTMIELKDEKYINYDKKLNDNTLESFLSSITSTEGNDMKVFVLQIPSSVKTPKSVPAETVKEDLSWMKKGFLKDDSKPEVKPAPVAPKPASTNKETGYMGLRKGFFYS